MGRTFYFIMEPIKHYKVTEITVAYQQKSKAVDRPVISQSYDALAYILEGYDKDTIALQEQFVIAYLNVGNQILGIYKASVGGMTGTIADIRLILCVALKVAATAMIISHNHPSGILRPSRADELITQKLKKAAQTMDIKLLDHLILEPTGIGYFSFADEGLI